MTFYSGACQNCLDLCTRQLCTDPVTTSPPPSLSPEPLGLGKGKDSPLSPRASMGVPKWSLMAGALVGQMFTSGKALSLCQGREGGLFPEVQLKLHRFAWILSSPGEEEHWELVVGVPGRGAWISSRILGKTDRCHIKAPLFPFLAGSSIPSPEFSEREPSHMLPGAQTGLEHLDTQSFCFMHWQ